MKRIELLDVWRSLAVVCMIAYHFLYDLGTFGVVPWTTVFSAPANALQLFICTSFITVSGVSSRLTKSNVRRGFIVLGCSVAVSAGAYAAGLPIWFGILHFLGASMVIYGLIGKFIERIPVTAAPFIYIALFFLSRYLTDILSPVSVKFLFPFGFTYAGFSSSDYFPLLPWFFLYLLGTWLGGVLTRHRDLALLNVRVPKALTWPGRHSLIIYVLHQPILYGICMLLF